MSVTEKPRRRTTADARTNGAAGTNGGLPTGHVRSDSHGVPAGGEEPASLRDRLAALIADGVEPEAAASLLADQMVAGKLKLTKRDMAAFVLPAFRAEARNIARALVRRHESEVRTLVADGVPFREAIQRLALDTAYVPSAERRVSWMDMTADQHDERATYFRDYENSYRESAEQHENAAREIRAAGVTCLRDLAAPGDAA